jgi:hypothetical protein
VTDDDVYDIPLLPAQVNVPNPDIDHYSSSPDNALFHADPLSPIYRYFCLYLRISSWADYLDEYWIFVVVCPNHFRIRHNGLGLGLLGVDTCPFLIFLFLYPSLYSLFHHIDPLNHDYDHAHDYDCCPAQISDHRPCMTIQSLGLDHAPPAKDDCSDAPDS